MVNKNWLLLLLAGFMEIFWVSGIKHASTLWMWIGTFIALGISFDLLVRVSRQLPVGTVYAISTGIGTVGSVLVGMLFYGESTEWCRILFICMVLSSAIGLKLLS